MTTIWLILFVVLFAGFLGGAAGGEIAECTHPPRRKRTQLKPFFFRNKECGRIFATRLGNIIFGGLSALFFWGLYGHLSAFPIIGTAGYAGHPDMAFLSLGDLVGSILVGTGGPAFLLAEARRRCAQSTKN